MYVIVDVAEDPSLGLPETTLLLPMCGPKGICASITTVASEGSGLTVNV